MKKMISLKHGILSLLLITGVILPAAEPDVPQQKAWRGTAKSGAKAENFKPVLSGDAIVCGNKTVTWSADGEIRISSGKAVRGAHFQPRASGPTVFRNFPKGRPRCRPDATTLLPSGWAESSQDSATWS